MEATSNRKKKLWILGTVYLALILSVLLIANLDGFNRILGKLLFYLRPVIIGLSIAYLSNPFFRLYELKLLYWVKRPRLRRTVALLLTYLTLFLILAVLMLLIVPQLITSIIDFVDNADALIDGAVSDINLWIDRLNQLLTDDEDALPLILPLNATVIKQSVTDFFVSIRLDSKKLMDLLSLDTLGTIFDMAGNILTLFADIIFGIFISIYLLSTKEKRYAQILRARHALFSDALNERITGICTVADQSFGGFLRGKLLDSSIVGVLVYVAISIMDVPYAILIAAIVAITDIVPIVGPFIGVIPSAVIILLTDPAKVIPFLLCILVVQQIDGNIIAPKILGENTGVSSLCVMIAITTMGSLWGLAGMVLGVPLFATVLELVNRALDKQLDKKGLPTLTDRYYASVSAEGESAESTQTPDAATDRAHSLPTDGGRGDVTDFELYTLDMHKLIKKHRLFTDCTKEELDHLAEDEVELSLITALHELPDTESEPDDTVDITEDAEANAEAGAEPAAEAEDNQA